VKYEDISKKQSHTKQSTISTSSFENALKSPALKYLAMLNAANSAINRQPDELRKVQIELIYYVIKAPLCIANNLAKMSRRCN
jgi:hypothetical protein